MSQYLPDEIYWREALQRHQIQRGGAVPLDKTEYQSIKELGHLMAVGPTRTGKTRFFEHLMLRVGQSPQKVTIIYVEPHGHSSDELLTHHALAGTLDKVVWLDPTEQHRILGYNAMQSVQGTEIGMRASLKTAALLAAQGIDQTESIDVMPRLRECYQNVFHALMEANLTLNEGLYLLASADNAVRPAIIKRLRTPLIRLYWESIENAKPAERERRLSIVRARFHKFWASPQLFHITGQATRSVDMAKLIETGKTVIIKSQPYRSGVSSDDVKLLMALLIEDLIAAVFSRPKDSGCWVVLVVDELGMNLISTELIQALQGSLKYRMSSWLGTQSLCSLEAIQPRLVSEVMANAMTKILFRDCSVDDLEKLAKEFSLESLDFSEVKDEITSTKFRPKETERTVETLSYGESETTGSMTSSASVSGATSGQSVTPVGGAFLADSSVTNHSSSMDTSISGSGEFQSQSSSWSHSVSSVPFTVHEEFKEVSSREFVSVEEQIARCQQRLKALKPREMALKQRGKTMKIIEVPNWPDIQMPEAWLRERIIELLEKSEFYGSIKQIQTQTQQRLNSLIKQRSHESPHANQTKHTATELEAIYGDESDDHE